MIESEAEAERCARALANSDILRLSAGNLIEAYMRIDRSELARAAFLVDEILDRFNIRVEPVTREQISLARVAFHRFGKGSGHPARLNYGDCFAYALAKQTKEPLLFVGNDFSQTDINVA